MNVVSVSSLVQVYDSESGPVEALRGVSLDIIPGTLTAISGPVGAGKSTLLSLLSGQMLPTDGTVLVWCQGASLAAVRGALSRERECWRAPTCLNFRIRVSR